MRTHSQRMEQEGENIKGKAYAMVVAVFLVTSFALIPMVVGAGSITLTPTSQTSGGFVSVSGKGFNPTTVAGIGFGKEVNVINETMPELTGPYDVAGGPYIGYVSHVPIKPGTYQKAVNISKVTFLVVDTDNGNGTFRSIEPTFVNGTINYLTGQLTLFSSTPIPSSTHLLGLANYTYYEYDVTPAAGVTTTASGAFAANIVVPTVASGNHSVTAIDATGNRAVGSLTVAATSPTWSKTYGGNATDTGTGETVQTSDGGYAISGDTKSFGAGGSDFWLIRTDQNGNMLWNKTYGGNLDEAANDMCLTGDSGYAIAGATSSFGAGKKDFWLVKTEATGNVQWNGTYGGMENDDAYYVTQTSDGGYAIIGNSNSFGAGQTEAWLVKTDANGTMLWNKTYGGTNTTTGMYVLQTADDGYVLGGATSSFGAIKTDAWLAKIDAVGTMLWNKTYGGAGNDYGQYLAETDDGGYIICAFTDSFGAGGQDCWLIKTDANGTVQWNKTYGGAGNDAATHVIQTKDGGYALTGSATVGNQELFLVKTDKDGNQQGTLIFGGTGTEIGYALLQTGDESYVLTGNTNSYGAGFTDVWLLKVDASVIPEFSSLLLVSLGLAATGFIVLCKKRMIHRL